MMQAQRLLLGKLKNLLFITVILYLVIPITLALSGENINFSLDLQLSQSFPFIGYTVIMVITVIIEYIAYKLTSKAYNKRRRSNE